MNAKGKVIATDLDGTLFYPRRRFKMIAKKNIEFLRRFIDEGGRLLLVSGRNINYLNKVKTKINRPVDFAGCNGSFIYVNNQLIRHSLIDNKKLNVMLDDIKKRFSPVSIFLMCDDYNFIIPKREFGLFNRFGYTVYQIYQGIYKEEAIKSDKLLHEQLENGKILKVMLFFGPANKAKRRSKAANKILRELYPDFEFSWSDQAIEITNASSSKALAIKVYLDYLKINHHNIMVVGDSGNDISMFRTYENSFCMANASDEIKKYAKNQIKSVSGIEKYL